MAEVDQPKPGPRDVLIRVRYSGICGTDLSILDGNMSLIRDGLIRYPVRIGHEWSGIVEKTGPGVSKVKPGDRVVGDNYVSCGECAACLREDYPRCNHMRGCVGTIDCWDGSFAEYMVMPEWHLYKLPDTIQLREAALIEPATIALNGLKPFNITKESTVLVIGTGAIGLAAVSMAKLAGAGRVISAGRKDSKLETGKRMGADAIVNVTREPLKEAVLRETNGLGVNFILETSSSIDYIRDAADYLSGKGILSLVGFYEKELDHFPVDRLVMNGLQILGLSGHDGVIGEVIGMMASGALDLKPLITHIYPFDDAILAFKTAGQLSDSKIKMLVEVNRS
jgi:2-desacetyl-2-hydroxyethyl bacteriochlorophyllide A dehydrogenase